MNAPENPAPSPSRQPPCGAFSTQPNPSVNRLGGIVPPMITPLRSGDELDTDGLSRLVEHMIGGGVNGLFVLGTTGEAPGLGYQLRRMMIEATCKNVSGRVPVLVGITDTASVEAMELSRFAADCGADALVMAPPYYFPNSQPELLEYFQRFAPRLPLPLFLYNMPTHTKTFLELGTLRQLMDVPNIAGIKDSSGNMVYFHHLIHLLKERPDWRVFMGPEELLAESVLLGGHGGVCGGANLCPRLYVDLYEAASSMDAVRAAELHKLVMEVSLTLYRVGRYGSAFIKGLKCALSIIGLSDDYMTDPFHRFEPKERAIVEEHLDRLGISAAHPYPRLQKGD